ncbi:MAG: maleylpyruvate isomerase N-terminal domain-containing protein [Bryobacteraceae bacterium]|nr:maleylpyruvate isomerase N-terminal domain-containing protein [Bryobacteraceae bacterium]
MRRAQPVLTAHLIAPLHQELMQLLAELHPRQWALPTTAGRWTVKDVAAHILDGYLRRLSACRDKAPLSLPRGTSLLSWLNGLNAAWVEAMNRVSPALLIDLLHTAGPQVAAFFEALDPHDRACFPVAWAADHQTAVWLDTGRDFTEHWHHQQQIRAAVGAPPLHQPRWLHPVLAISAFAIPLAYASLPHATVAFDFTGEGGGHWSLIRGRLHEGHPARPDALVRLPAATAAALFLKALSPNAARAVAECQGDPSRAAPFFQTLALIG